MFKKRLKPGAFTEANVQFNIAFKLRDLGFNARVEVVPIGYPSSRFDVVILNSKTDIIAVIEVKNASGYKQCVSRETLLRKEEQGIRYQSLADKHDFKLFYCGGMDRIDGCVSEIQESFQWYVRILGGI